VARAAEGASEMGAPHDFQALPRDDAFRYRKALIDKGPTEISAGERSDVSWISTEHPDRVGDVVLARGMNDSQFKLNPIVTLQHNYALPPVGKSLWRKTARDGDSVVVKAKTVYPARPADWPQGKDWPPDIAFTLVQADLLRGKSIGFLPTRVHTPDRKEADKHGWGDAVHLVIDKWLLLEYACVYLPAQQNAVLESVGKSLPAEYAKALGIETATPAAPAIVPHVTLDAIEQALAKTLQSIDLNALVKERIEKARGRV
jgi:hypothetical protein